MHYQISSKECKESWHTGSSLLQFCIHIQEKVTPGPIHSPSIWQNKANHTLFHDLCNPFNVHLNDGCDPRVHFICILTCWCESTQLPVFVNRLAYPHCVWIASNGLVEWIYHDDIKVFVGRILTNPVTVHYTQTATLPANTLLGERNKDT